MDLTWVLAGSLLLVATGYGVVRAVSRPRLLQWGLLGTALFGLAVRDLLRPREQGQISVASNAEVTTEADAVSRTEDASRRRERAASYDDERTRLARLCSRITGWLG